MNPLWNARHMMKVIPQPFFTPTEMLDDKVWWCSRRTTLRNWSPHHPQRWLVCSLWCDFDERTNDRLKVINAHHYNKFYSFFVVTIFEVSQLVFVPMGGGGRGGPSFFVSNHFWGNTASAWPEEEEKEKNVIILIWNSHSPIAQPGSKSTSFLLLFFLVL